MSARTPTRPSCPSPVTRTCALCHALPRPRAGLSQELQGLVAAEGWEVVRHELRVEYAQLNAEQVLRVRRGRCVCEREGCARRGAAVRARHRAWPCQRMALRC